MRLLVGVFLSVATVLLPARHALSQETPGDVVDVLADLFDDGELAETFQSLSIVGIAPGLSGAKFSVDGDEGDSDLDINSVKLPLAHDFKNGAFCFVRPEEAGDNDYELQRLGKRGSDGGLCTRLYVELTLSYLNAEQRVGVDDVDSLDVDITSLSALAGLGLIFDIAEGTTFRPILLGGYSHISNDSVFEGDGSAGLNEVGDGTVVDAELDTFIFGGAAELRREQVFENRVELEGRLRYNHLVTNTFEASDGALEGTNDFIVVTGKLEAGVPTGLTFFSRDIYALGFGGTNLLLESFGDGIDGGDFIHEIGGGLEVKKPLFFKGIRLRGSYLFGEDTTGWRAGIGIKF